MRVSLLFTLTLMAVYIHTCHAGWCGDCWCSLEANETCPERPQNYTETFTTALAAQIMLNPPFTLNCDPYDTDIPCNTVPVLPTAYPTSVCAYRFVDKYCDGGYKMATFDSAEDAANSGYTITHTGPCGLCSSMQDLASYMNIFDMTSAGKKCGALAVVNEQWGLNCFMNLGLTKDCAKIWNYDAIYDASACGLVCVEERKQPYNGDPPECLINECLQCDEDEAGPIFKKFAARTRRSSGLESAITRPCNTVATIEHHICPQPQ